MIEDYHQQRKKIIKEMGATMKAYIQEQAFVEQRKQEKRDQLLWDKKIGGSKAHSNADISVSIIKSGDSFQVRFTFRNDVEQLIDANNIGRMESCIDKNRIYFRAIEDGYKIFHDNNQASVRHSHYKKYMPFVGNYELEYSQELDFYYIEKGTGEP